MSEPKTKLRRETKGILSSCVGFSSYQILVLVMCYFGRSEMTFRGIMKPRLRQGNLDTSCSLGSQVVLCLCRVAGRCGMPASDPGIWFHVGVDCYGEVASEVT